MSETTKQKCDSCGSDELPLKKCAGCGTVAYCGTKCQVAHWPLHRPACKLRKKEIEREKAKDKAKEAARGSGGNLGDMGSIMAAALMSSLPPKRYHERDVYNACFHDHHEELEKMLKQLGLDANWVSSVTGATAALVAAQKGQP